MPPQPSGAKKQEKLRTAPARKSVRAVERSGGTGVDWRSKDRAAFVVQVLGGTRSAARVLDVAASQASRWASGEAVPDPENARTLIDLDHILALALQVWTSDVAVDWLQTANAYLDGARPIDVVRVDDPGEVVAALRAEAAGAYA